MELRDNILKGDNKFCPRKLYSLKHNWGMKCENVGILVTIADNEDGYREVLALPRA